MRQRRRDARSRGTLAALAALIGLGGCGPSPDGGANAPLVTDTLLSVGSTRLFVHTEGRGEPLVVVHGGPVLDHGYLVEPLEPLAHDGYELVFYDQRLSGRSEGVVDSASVRLDTLVADIDRLREALGFERVHLLGHSWGGLLAMRYAVAHPDRLRSLVLVSSMPPSSELWQAEQRAQQAALEPADTAGMGAVQASGAYGAGEPAAIERLLQLSFRGALHDPSLADSLRFHVEPDYGERSRQFGYMLPDLLGYDVTGELPALDVPTLVVYGADEEAAGRMADTLGTLLPRAQVEVMDDAGHFAFLERPEAFRRLLQSFLEERSRPGG